MAIIEKLGSGKYRVRVWDKSLGKRFAAGTFPTRTAARAAGLAAEAEMASRGFIQERKDITFGDLCSRHEDATNHLGKKSQGWYAGALKPAKAFFGESASVRRIGREQVQLYAAALIRQRKSATTVRSYIRVLGTLMNHAIDWGYREDNPASRLRNLPKNKRGEDAIRVVSREEHERLTAATPVGFRQGRGKLTYQGYRTMIWLMPFVGLRRSEIQGLTWEHVDLDGGTLRVEQQLREDGTLDKALKTSKSRRTVCLPDRAIKALRAWKLACPPNWLDLVFPTQRGLPQSKSQFYRVWHKACEGSELKGLDPHDLRHTFATWHLAAGVNVKWVADQMGHENPSITLDTYAHLLPTEDERAASKVQEWYDSQPGAANSTAHMLPTKAVTAV